MHCPTVQIHVEPSEGNPEGIVTINEHDYDPTQHRLVGAPESSVPDAPPALDPPDSAVGIEPEGGKKKKAK